MADNVFAGDSSWASPPDTTTDSTTSTDTTDSETVTTTDTSFHDGVRTTFPQDDNITSEKRYEDPDGDGQADDVDVRGLFRKPTVDLLRYHARENPYGRPIVRKPVEDSFKHGFQTEGGGDDDAQAVQQFLHDHLSTLKRAIIYARMDGLVVVMHQVADAAQSVEEPLDTRTASFEGLKLWTLDHLTDDIRETEAADNTDYEQDQLNVTEGPEHGGVIFVDDISSPDHGKVVGYGVEPRDESEDVQSATFVHASRCHHLTWDDHVQGPLGNEISGQHVGESILTPILQPLEAAQMGFWATKNILFRYSAPLHAVEPPESWSEDEFEAFTEQLEDLSMASDATLPPGAELSVAEGVSEFDPEPFYETLVSAMCAGTEFTRSVLQGTQTGTVSGSETDIKGYFSDVHVFRTNYVDNFFHEVTEHVGRYDQSTIPRAAAFNWEMDWGPLFKPDDLEKAEGAVSLITAATNGIKNYVLTPDEARTLLSEEWGTFDLDVSLGDLTEDQMDIFDRINVREVGRGPKDDEPTGERQNPRLQNGGGQPEGQTREQSQPTTDEIADQLVDGVADEVVDQVADEVVDRLTENDS